MTETFAHLSNNAMYSATIVYALAMLAHVVEWAKARDLPPTPSQTLVRSAANVSASAVPSPPGLHDPAKGAEPTEDEIERTDRWGRIGFSLTVLGMLLQAVGVVTRGIAAQRVPWGSMYEFAITGSLAVVVAYVLLVRRYAIRWLGLFVTGFLVTVLGIAMIVLYRPVGPLVPALHSYWLAIHVSAAAVAGGAFTIGALASVLFLVRSRMEAKAVAHPERPQTGFLWRAPSSESIDRVAYRVHAFAFPLWTFAVLAGAIWAEYAWGRFWGWDPKEVWAFITWVAYAAYLHARATAGWRGRAAAYVALLGYATFLFNFVGINLFGSGLHSYSGM
ncbi:MAG TPA: c-type cytochrome biogenesis protein CcsB [Nocardioidaceae bacterium]